MWTWGEDNIASLCFGVIKGIRKRGEFKISLFNSRGGKILNSTTSGREQMGRGGREKKGCVKCGVC